MDTYGTKKSDGTWEMEKYNAETLFEDIKVDSGKKDKENKPIMTTKSVDSVTAEEYAKKLKIKKKEYFGGLIILADGECKQGTTKNMMDYHNKRELFLSNQIKVMRSDIQNYMDIAVSKPTAKKK